MKDIPALSTAGPYEILEIIGSGGMGSVYKARHKTLDRIVALKTLNKTAVSDEMLQRFIREGAIMSRLQHQNIAVFYEYGLINESIPFIAMEYLDGISLDKLLETAEKLDLNTTLNILIQVCHGIAHAHGRSVIHRDLKPSNIMLLKTDGKLVAKLIDFGLSKFDYVSTDKGEQKEQQLTATGLVLGTVAYMSPEQCVGRNVDYRTDIYSIGCILFQCLADKHPYNAEYTVQLMQQHLQSVIPSLPIKSLDSIETQKALQAVIEKALQKDPGKRYKSAKDMANDLEKLQISDIKQLARPEVSSIKLTKAHQAMMPLFLTGLMIFILGLGAILISGKHITSKTSAALSPVILKQAVLLNSDLNESSPPDKTEVAIEKISEAIEANKTDNLLDSSSLAWLQTKLAMNRIFRSRAQIPDFRGIPESDTTQATDELCSALSILRKSNLPLTYEAILVIAMLAEHGNYGTSSLQKTRLLSDLLLYQPIKRQELMEVYNRGLCGCAELLFALGKQSEADDLINRAKAGIGLDESADARLCRTLIKRCLSEGKVPEAMAVSERCLNKSQSINLETASEVYRASFFGRNKQGMKKSLDRMVKLRGIGRCDDCGINMLIDVDAGRIDSALDQENSFMQLIREKPLLALKHDAEVNLKGLRDALEVQHNQTGAAKVQNDLLAVQASTKAFIKAQRVQP